MRFSDRLIRVDTLLRIVIRESIERGFFHQKHLAGHIKVQGRTLKNYYEEGSKKVLAINELAGLVDYIALFNFSEHLEDDDEFYETIKELEQCCAEQIGEGHYELPLQLSPNTAGDKNDLQELEGTYFVMRRLLTKKTVMVSLIEITYDEDRNLGLWTNTHTGTTGPTHINGVITQSGGIFHFTGYLATQSTMQAMSLPKGSNGWDQLSGIVLTQSALSPIGSRVALCRTEDTPEAALEKCGEISIEDAQAIGLSSSVLLDNSCDETGVLTPYTDW